MGNTYPEFWWLSDDPEQIMQSQTVYRKELKGFKWNYGPELKRKGWQGVWENFCRLYTYWGALLPQSMGGLRHESNVATIPEARLIYQDLLLRHGSWHMKRRVNLPYMRAFLTWLLSVGKPMDREMYDWYPDTLNVDPATWRTSYGNPRKLPASSMYVVNAERWFSNQHQPDGPFVMSIHSRGYKNAQMNYLAAPWRRGNKTIVTEYSKWKRPPLNWASILPYPCTIGTSQYGRLKYNFQQGDPKLSFESWQKQLQHHANNPVPMHWGSIGLIPPADPLFLSIEPQDIQKPHLFIPSINYEFI